VVVDEATFRKLFVAPYPPSIKEGVASIMVSYNSWHGTKLHGHKQLLTDVLKKELGFRGFLISDWAAIDQLPGEYKSDVEQSINAGLDMIMIPNGPDKPNNYVQFVDYLKQLVAEGKVPMSRIDDAVTRILWAKFEMNLFQHPYAAPELMKQIGSAAHRKVARECVRQSLVLLKNEGKALPLSEKAPRIVVVGKAADDLGIQCGGWTIDWQGKTGAVTPGGTTILQGLKAVSDKPEAIVYSADGSGIQSKDVAVVVIGELPYAEMKGDRPTLDVSAEDAALVAKARQAGAKVVTVVLSGRPLVLGPVLAQSDAVVAAWLPGTEGQGVADVLFGEVKPKGKLPRHWPKDNSQLDSLALGNAQPLFPRGYGLSY
jgi:beta-glucosidase